ncbi:MAG: NRDE family protein, partial [Myxococcaceae bacterium]
MCTLFVAWKQHPRFPLLVAANRDENLQRPASGPRLWPGAQPFVAPVDEQAGGSWVGLNARRVFCAITNRYLTTRYPERRSRGEIVTEVLRLPSADAIWKRMQRLDPRSYNAFHLLYADADRAFVSWTDGEKITHEELVQVMKLVCFVRL